MSEDSSDDEGCRPSSEDECPVKGKLKETCLECGKTFQSLSCLISHYKSHNVQATCHICQVTFSHLTSLSTHLTNAHSDSPHCEVCNLWFNNKWEFNKHQATHLTAQPFITQGQNMDLLANECFKYLAEEHSYGCNSRPVNAVQQQSEAESEDSDMELMPVASFKTQEDGHKPIVKHQVHSLSSHRVGGVEMEIPYETNSDESEDTEDSTTYQDKEGEIEISDGDEGSLHTHGHQELAEKQSHTYKDASSDGDSDDTTGDSGSESVSSETSSTPSGTIKCFGKTRNTPTSQCSQCGQGPYKNVKVHLRHCPGKMPMLHCSLCEQNFPSAKMMQEHKVRLFICNLCKEAFHDIKTHRGHFCFKGLRPVSPTVIFTCMTELADKGLARALTQPKRPQPHVKLENHVSRPVEVEGVEVEIPYQAKHAKSEDKVDSMCLRDKGVGIKVNDGEQSSSGTHRVQGCVREQSPKDKNSSSDGDSEFSAGIPALESGSESSSSEASSIPPYNDKVPREKNSTPSLMCSQCGQGPYKNVKVHMLHCNGKRPVLHCKECKRDFPNMKSKLEHKVRLYLCQICDKQFRHWNSYRYHICPCGNKPKNPTVIYSCTAVAANKCNLCKAIFFTEKQMLKHIVTAHGTNLYIKKNPATSVVEQTYSTSVNSGLVNSVNSIYTGKPSIGQSPSGSVPIVLCSPSLPSPSSSKQDIVPVAPKLATGARPNYVILKQPSSITVSQVAQQNNTIVNRKIEHQPQRMSSQGKPNLVPFVTPKGASILKSVPSIPTSSSSPAMVSRPTRSVKQVTTSSSNQGTPVSVASRSETTTPPLNIVAMFKNDSREMALKKRMNTSWRYKATYPCRQCGAISRQPSLNISHRYLHRGQRSHHCHCGRAFLHQLHLLRHCVQHAEATTYICVSCGETFEGAGLLEKHIKGFSKRSSPFRPIWDKSTRKECKVPFSCDCGLVFVRPSAYIWHQLRNAPKAKCRRKRLK